MMSVIHPHWSSITLVGPHCIGYSRAFIIYLFLAVLVGPGYTRIARQTDAMGNMSYPH